MKPVSWKVRSGKRILEEGTASGDARSVLRQIMKRELGRFKLVPSESYVVEVDGLVTGLYGDEFGSIPVVDEKKLTPSGHLVAPMPVKNYGKPLPDPNRVDIKHVKEDRFGVVLGTQHRERCSDGTHYHDMNDQELKPTGLHAKCRKCGFVDPVPCRRSQQGEIHVLMNPPRYEPGAKADEPLDIVVMHPDGRVTRDGRTLSEEEKAKVYEEHLRKMEADRTIDIEISARSDEVLDAYLKGKKAMDEFAWQTLVDADHDRKREQKACVHANWIGWRNHLDFTNAYKCQECEKTIVVSDQEMALHRPRGMTPHDYIEHGMKTD